MSYGDFKAQKIALEAVGERNAQAVKLIDKQVEIAQAIMSR